MPPTDPFRFGKQIGKEGGARRRRGKSRKIDRAVKIDRLMPLEPRLLLAGIQLVTNLNDSGAGSLRQDIANVATGGLPLIEFQGGVTGSINLLSGLTLSLPVTIGGPGASAVSVLGGANIRPFLVTTSGAEIDGLTIANGNVAGFGGGVSFAASSGTLTLDNDDFVNNQSASGGGAVNVSTGGTVSLTNDTFVGNVASGGGGGAIINEFGAITVTNSTFFNNSASGGGGGGALYTHGSATGANTFLNSTIYANHDNGPGSAGGIWDVDLNVGVTLRNTIVAGNTSTNDPGSPDTYGQVANNGGNLIGGSPNLGPLANLGSGTPTLALLPGSPAIGGGLVAGAPATDQRGVSRTGHVDIGAFQADHDYFPVTVNYDSTDAGTLRTEINASNATTPIGGNNIIYFGIAGAGVQTISPTSVLPPVRTNAAIDATSQLSYSGTPVVQLDGSLLGAGNDGLVNQAASATVKGLAIVGFGGSGLDLQGGSGTGDVIQSNYLGVLPDGVTATANGFGITLINGQNNTIGGTTPGAGNVISGNSVAGIFVPNGSFDSGDLIEGNLIGTNAAGSAAVPNAMGVEIDGGGGSNTLSGNVISGNTQYGVYLNSPVAIQNLLVGNVIGADRTGMTAVGNGVVGIEVESGSAGNTIGAPGAANRNVISGNDNGIGLSGGVDNLVINNYVGVDVTGRARLANASQGIVLSNGAIGNTVGGVFGATGNVISGNGFDGINIYGVANNLVAGNAIGTDSSGASAIANGWAAGGASGIDLQFSGATGNTIGGLTSTPGTGPGNVISGNAHNGIGFFSNNPAGNVILGNVIGAAVGGLSPLANAGNGVYLGAGSSNTIGGPTATARNLIGGNAADGISFSGASVSNNTVLNNDVGVDLNGRSLGPGAVAWFKAEGTATDAINGTTGSLGRGVTYGTGEVGLSFNFDGTTNSTITLPGSATGPLDITGNQITIESWVYQTDRTQANNSTIQQQILDKYSPTSGYALYTLNGVLRFSGTTTVTTRFILDAPSAIPLNAWTHVAVTYDGVTARMFVNGVQVSSIALTGTLVHSPGIVAIGNHNVGTAYGFKGKIDELTVYSRALDADEIQSIVNSGTTGKANPLGNGLIGIEDAAGPSNTFGLPGAGNVISGNRGGSGLAIHGPTAINNLVQGNLIGTDATGRLPVPNIAGGITLSTSANGNTIGGIAAGAGNVISGNVLDGVNLGSAGTSNNVVAGNLIGLNAAGTALGNSRFGVEFTSGAIGDTIGGLTAASRNVISANANAGVYLLAGATGNLIAGNYVGTDTLGGTAIGNVGGVYDAAGGNTISANVLAGSAGYAGIELDGSGTLARGNYTGTNAGATFALGNYNGVGITGANNTVTGNIISGNTKYSIIMGGAGATGNLIQANYLGLDITGEIAISNAIGARISSGPSNNTFGGTTAAARNVFAGNGQAGLQFDAGSSNNLVEGNYFGTDHLGNHALGSVNNDINIQTGSNNETIGGTIAGAGNVISGGRQYGVDVDGSAGTLIAGNLIGTDALGATAIPNGLAGIIIQDGASNTSVGGLTPASRNLLSGNTGNGVSISGAATSGNLVAGNFLGTNLAGTGALANGGSGVEITSQAHDNTIGGYALVPGTGAGNLIAANPGIGIFIHGGATNNLVAGDSLGLSANGSTPLGNGGGIYVQDAGTTGNTIGGLAATARNLITNSGSGGIVIRNSALNNLVVGNYVGVLNDGRTRAGNLQGIRINGPTTGNTIGGTTQAARNVISGNGIGISVTLSLGGVVGIPSANVVLGNYIGLAADGATSVGNTVSGVQIGGGATNNTIGGFAAGSGNVIAGNAVDGVVLNGAVANVLAGNRIGTKADGQAALANGDDGVLIDGASTGNTIGGAAPGAGNLVSGNAQFGVWIWGAGVDSNVVQGNQIGINAAGAAAIANGADGVLVGNQAVGNTIGGTASGAANVISGNAASGVHVTDPGTTADLVLGNRIGTNAAGNAAIANAAEGVLIGNGAVGNTIGGAAPGAGNLISGNSVDGLDIYDPTTSGNVVQGNFIGTNAAGSSVLVNVGNGISIVDAPNNTIGGTAGGAANVVTTVNDNAIAIGQAGATGNVVEGNLVGTDKTGKIALGDSNSYGIYVYGSASANTIGGTAAGAGNVASGGWSTGIHITGGAFANVVAGNDVGTDVTGNAALGNVYAGIEVYGSPDNTIGGTAAGAGNVSSGNGGAGIALDFDATVRTVIAGNLLGVGADGHTPLHNAYTGVDLANGANANTIGGTAAGSANVIANNQVAGVLLYGTSPGNGGPLANNVVAGNLIGVLANGTAAGNAGPGVELIGTLGPATGNTIGGNSTAARNVIAANTGPGISLLNSGDTGNLIAANFIGVGPDGATALPNAIGVSIIAAPGNYVGGDSTAGYGNVISGNTGDGIYLDPSLHPGTLVQGNVIGLKANGSAAVPNTGDGVHLDNNPNNTIGGLNAGLGNTIGGNAGAGVDIAGAGSIKNLIIGNFIGTNGAGAAGLGNALDGVTIESAAYANTIGGVVAGARNVISGNAQAGVMITGAGSSSNVLQGNRIGTDAAGMAAVPNGDGDGNDITQAGVLIIAAGAADNLVGGVVPGAGNLIAGSTSHDLDHQPARGRTGPSSRGT